MNSYWLRFKIFDSALRLQFCTDVRDEIMKPVQQALVDKAACIIYSITGSKLLTHFRMASEANLLLNPIENFA